MPVLRTLAVTIFGATGLGDQMQFAAHNLHTKRILCTWIWLRTTRRRETRERARARAERERERESDSGIK